MKVRPSFFYFIKKIIDFWIVSFNYIYTHKSMTYCRKENIYIYILESDKQIYIACIQPYKSMCITMYKNCITNA